MRVNCAGNVKGRRGLTGQDYTRSKRQDGSLIRVKRSRAGDAISIHFTSRLTTIETWLRGANPGKHVQSSGLSYEIAMNTALLFRCGPFCTQYLKWFPPWMVS
jgi:hypothetical protein